MSVNIHKFEYWKFVMARNKEEHVNDKIKCE